MPYEFVKILCQLPVNTTDFTKFQRMRERNNEASKRCRLKRRLKAESMETQATLLQQCNRSLRKRVARMEKIYDIMQESVKLIQTKKCQCSDAVTQIQRANSEEEQEKDKDNAEVIQESQKCRKVNIVVDSKWNSHSAGSSVGSCSGKHWIINVMIYLVT